MQSGRLVKMSKSYTASPSRVSIPSIGRPAAVRRAPTLAGSSAMLTYDCSHWGLNFMRAIRRVPAASSRALRQESQIGFEKQPDVVDSVLEHRDAPEAKT